MRSECKICGEFSNGKICERCAIGIGGWVAFMVPEVERAVRRCSNRVEYLIQVGRKFDRGGRSWNRFLDSLQKEVRHA